MFVSGKFFLLSHYLSDNYLDQLWIFAPTKHSLPRYQSIKVFSPKAIALPPTFNYTNRSPHPSLPAWLYNNFCKYFLVLIVTINSCNVFVFYFCIFSNKLDLSQETCSVRDEARSLPRLLFFPVIFTMAK